MSAENPRQQTKDLFLAKKIAKKSRLSFSSSSGPILTFVPPPPPPSAVDKLGFWAGKSWVGRREGEWVLRLGLRRAFWGVVAVVGQADTPTKEEEAPSHFSVFGIAAPKSPLLFFLGGARRSSRGGGGEILDRFFKKPQRILMANLGRVCFNS